MNDSIVTQTKKQGENNMQTPNLTKALIGFQKAVKPAKFDANNPYYNSRYASLGEIINTVKSEAGNHGLTWIQLPISEGDRVGVRTILMHESGEQIEDSILVQLPPTYVTNSKGIDVLQNQIQETGKYITYLRRYALASVFGLYAEEDNDGNQRDGNPRQPKQTSSNRQPASTQTPTKKTEKPKIERPYKPTDLKKLLMEHAPKLASATASQQKEVVAVLSQYAGDDETRHKVQNYLFGAESIKDVNGRIIAAAHRWLDAEWNSQEKVYLLPDVQAEELFLVIEEATK
jgi:hypothetical protein